MAAGYSRSDVNLSDKRLYLVVAACAVVVHVGALWNRFAMDDNYIILHNAVVHSLSGVWRAFLGPYWPADFGGKAYRPLAVATYAVDWQLNSAMWYHAANLLWHMGATLALTLLARRWLSPLGAFAAGLLFAVHPVHVEAIANVIGRAELMAGAFLCLAVYAALIKESVFWSLLAFAGALLSKENGAVVPGLVVFAWLLGFPRPPRRKIVVFVASWVLLAAVYGAVRWSILHPFAHYENVAPVFVGEGHLAVRLTGIAALADVTRLLFFPLTLRADYSPAERTIVRSPLDLRFAVGLACLALWAVLVIVLWRRGRRVEAFGLGWIGIAFLPVANLVFPAGILIAERNLYVPSMGLALAFGSWLDDRTPRVYWATLAGVVAFGAVRSAVRVPAWRSDLTITMSILADSPRSYVGPVRTGAFLLAKGQPHKALAAFREGIQIFDRGHTTYVGAAAAAFAAGQPALAHEYMRRADQLCVGCPGGYRGEALAALARGDSAVADSLLAHIR
jgi:hypothetical protein